jgi:hypothetical protein
MFIDFTSLFTFNKFGLHNTSCDSEPELKMAVRTKSFDLSMEISDPETHEVKFESLKEISNLKTKSGNDVKFSHFHSLTY